jgi:predicted AlkP superfamily pyrophosphatase or phosphodiesterase
MNDFRRPLHGWLLCAVILGACSPADRIVDYAVPPVSSPTGGVNAPEQRDKPYLVLVSLDGFRWDYPDRALTPTLSRIAREGVRAERLLPVFPTLTFPNHYSLVTGLYPARHGIVANEFPLGAGAWYRIHDRTAVETGSSYGGEPLWVTAERQGMVAAAFFWVGSEADIGGVRPSHWRRFTKEIKGAARVDQVLAWLAEPPATRPHFYTLYFEDVDDSTHWYGPESKEGDEAIRRADRYLARLLKGIERLPHGHEVNLVVVSDHGQGRYRQPVQPLLLDSFITLEGITAVDGGSYCLLYFDAPDLERAALIRDQVNARWQHGRAWLKGKAPAAWQVDGNARFADVILVADAGQAVLSTEARRNKINTGDHGWRPEDPGMHGIFLAWGPAFKAGVRSGPVRNVDVHPLLLQVLGLEGPAATDGDPQTLRALLR